MKGNKLSKRKLLIIPLLAILMIAIVGGRMDTVTFAESSYSLDNYLWGVTIDGQTRQIATGNPSGLAGSQFSAMGEISTGTYQEIPEVDSWTGRYIEPVASTSVTPSTPTGGDSRIVVSSWGYQSSTIDIDGRPLAATGGKTPTVSIAMSNLRHVDEKGTTITSLATPYKTVEDKQYHKWAFDVTFKTLMSYFTAAGLVGNYYYPESDTVSVTALMRIHLVRQSDEAILGSVESCTVLATKSGVSDPNLANYVYTTAGQAWFAGPFQATGSKVNTYKVIQSTAANRDYVFAIGTELRCGFDYSFNWIGGATAINHIGNPYTTYTLVFTTITQMPSDIDESYSIPISDPTDAQAAQNLSQWGEIFGGIMNALLGSSTTMILIILVIGAALVVWSVSKFMRPSVKVIANV